MNKIEKRNIDNSEFRFIEDGNAKIVEGYALVFDSESKDLGGFTEVIKREAINDSTDMSDVIGLINHSMNHVLARKNSEVNTLQLEVDDKGLKYRFELDMEISYQKDLYLNMRKGNISKSSFAFRIAQGGDTWEKRSNGTYLRTIKSFGAITDISVVTNPAYQDTVSLTRSFEEIKTELDKTTEEVKDKIIFTKLNEAKMKMVSIKN